jgi:hypothetical protein
MKDESFASKRCVEVGFPTGTVGHADCVRRYSESAGIRKSAMPKLDMDLGNTMPAALDMDLGNTMPAAKIARLMGQQAVYKGKQKLDALRTENPDAYQKGMVMANTSRYAKMAKDSRRNALREMLGLNNSKFTKKNLDTQAEDRRNIAGDTYKKGGKVTASSRADGIAMRGKTKGRMI